LPRRVDSASQANGSDWIAKAAGTFIVSIRRTTQDALRRLRRQQQSARANAEFDRFQDRHLAVAQVEADRKFGRLARSVGPA
jgi:hypothetical protein